VNKWHTGAGVSFIVLSFIVLFSTLVGIYSPCFGWIDFLIYFVVGIVLIVRGLGEY